MDAVLDAELEVVHHDARVREVDDRLGPGLDEQSHVVVLVDLRDELQVVGRPDRLTHLATDLAPGPEDTHLELAHGISLEGCVSRAAHPHTTPHATHATASTSNGGSGSSDRQWARRRSRPGASSEAT